MATWRCSDGNEAIDIEAEDAREAAEEYIANGDWNERETTLWISVRCRKLTPGDEMDTYDAEEITVTLHPDEPPCSKSGRNHSWKSPIEVVGGIEENPGIRGNAGGVIIQEVCRHCGTYRETNTWATNPETGKQGLRSVSYMDADETSLDWIRDNKVVEEE
jgi:hypothetical protein